MIKIYYTLMKIRKSNNNFDIKITVLVLLLTIASIKYLDKEIAINVMLFLKYIHPLHKVTENIPDFLPYLVAAGTIIMWALYFYRLHKNLIDVKTKFLQVAATALPSAYFIKTFLKFIFGRTDPRIWLTANKPLVFHWFDKIESGSFPSGHMTVFAAFGTAILFYFPQYRKYVLALLIVLGAALIGTDYHFLSDVIAGAYLGYITTFLIRLLYRKADKTKL